MLIPIWIQSLKATKDLLPKQALPGVATRSYSDVLFSEVAVLA